MLISVQSKKRDASGNLIATVLDGTGGTRDVRLSSKDAAEVERVWALNQFDLDRYAALPVEFPTPAAVPVEINSRV